MLYTNQYETYTTGNISINGNFAHIKETVWIYDRNYQSKNDCRKFLKLQYTNRIYNPKLQQFY